MSTKNSPMAVGMLSWTEKRTVRVGRVLKGPNDYWTCDSRDQSSPQLARLSRNPDEHVMWLLAEVGKRS